MASISITLIILNPLVTYHQSPNPDLAYEELIQNNAYFVYKKPGHITIKCPEKAKTISKLNIEQGKDLPSLEI